MFAASAADAAAIPARTTFAGAPEKNGTKACSKAPFATVDFEFPNLIDDGIAESVAENLGEKVATAMVAALLCG